ncbi:hypothetical protein STRMA_1243 [Streptococcus macacae NCTC 11558]|uniref:Uncharacterized protein n=1 Tax=Streptococcus macacae NCTC 11558 TaxID=764298 RepID=G5JWU6_9STRE|nr:hypothetical protein STRMA_1243 [Streptococcus macacae NCTC 11558]
MLASFEEIFKAHKRKTKKADPCDDFFSVIRGCLSFYKYKLYSV